MEKHFPGNIFYSLPPCWSENVCLVGLVKVDSYECQVLVKLPVCEYFAQNMHCTLTFCKSSCWQTLKLAITWKCLVCRSVHHVQADKQKRQSIIASVWRCSCSRTEVKTFYVHEHKTSHALHSLYHPISLYHQESRYGNASLLPGLAFCVQEVAGTALGSLRSPDSEDWTPGRQNCQIVRSYWNHQLNTMLKPMLGK